MSLAACILRLLEDKFYIERDDQFLFPNQETTPSNIPLSVQINYFGT